MGHPRGSDDPPDELVVDLAPEPRAVTRARQWALDVASDWEIPVGLAERLALVVTELAANAVVHARSPFRVRLARHDGVVWGAVSDKSLAEPIELRPAPRATAGRGLMLVRRLADRSGIRDGRDGKSIWFELDAPPPRG